MKKYEYASLELYSWKDDLSVERLNELGNQGWELVSVVEKKTAENPKGYKINTAYLKREKL